MNKVAYLRSLEALIAVIITFSFLASTYNPQLTNKNEENKQTLIKLLGDDEFRNNIFTLVDNCEYKTNNTLLVNLTKPLLEDYDFVICNRERPSLPKKTVFLDSVYITGNITNSLDDGVIKLYYWKP
ncbi:hypothetical protein GOV05_05060 [Candidatus Woesearchaeota archaeon]|nr:hypothetical protein [Candidatus Woesearchaeota archaeon]